MRRKKNRNGTLFDAARRLSRDQQREQGKALRVIVDSVRKMGIPAEYVAHRLIETVLSERRLWRRFLERRFNMQVVNTDGYDHLVGINKGHLAHRYTSREELAFLLALEEHARWEVSYRVMLERGVKALDELEGWHWSDDRKRYWASLAAVEGFVLSQSHSDDYMSFAIQPESIDPRLRELVAGKLTGQVEERISLSQNKRLKATLREQGRNARTELQNMLPAAVIEEWEAAGSELFAGKYRNFRSRIARNLERSGTESSYLERLGKLSLSELGEVAEDTDDLSDFERWEEARQQLDSLEKYITFSEQQAEIWQRLKRGMEIAEIASELDIPRQQVSTQKARIKRKMQKARRAVGF
jgi:DNA-binding CsgD family transcriptional regulator